MPVNPIKTNRVRNLLLPLFALGALGGETNIFKRHGKFKFPVLPPKQVDPSVKAARKLRKSEKQQEHRQHLYAIQNAHDLRIQRMKTARRLKHLEAVYV